MRLGIFESIFAGYTVAAKFDALTRRGFGAVQFDLKSAGLATTLPDDIPEKTIQEIRKASNDYNVEIAALAGTFNMIDPDVKSRQENLARLILLIEHAPLISARIVTVCTGTRDRESMWRYHPGNRSDSAWNDLIATLTPAVRVAEEHGITLGVEPEPANVIDNAVRARRLLDEIGSDNLAIIADPANLLAGARQRTPEAVLDDAFDLLGDRIVLAHAKDLDAYGEFAPAGTGIVPWSRFGDLLRQVGYDGAVICHSLAVRDIDRAKEVLLEARIPA